MKNSVQTMERVNLIDKNPINCNLLEKPTRLITNTKNNHPNEQFLSNKTVAKAITDIITQKNVDLDDDAFYICDLRSVLKQVKRWKKHLPRITPHYAVKCNTDPVILDLFNELGLSFDCASKQEIAMIRQLGVEPERIIFANPTKPLSHLKYAREQNVTRMTFDSSEELFKIKRAFPGAEVLLRVRTDGTKAICNLSTKYGADPNSASKLLRLSKELGLKCIGVSFHVGSGCFDTNAYIAALETARAVFDTANDLCIHTMKVLDIGGGFPGDRDPTICFDDIAAVVGPAVDEMFDSSIEVIAEPGRYFTAASHTLVTSVIAKKSLIKNNRQNQTLSVRRDVSPQDASSLDGKEEDKYLYYINDGVYGSFNNIVFDHAKPVAIPVYERSKELHRCTVFGPTCDSLDLVLKNTLLPELEVGDWLYWAHMGAYTTAAACNFNGFMTPSKYYLY